MSNEQLLVLGEKVKATTKDFDKYLNIVLEKGVERTPEDGANYEKSRNDMYAVLAEVDEILGPLLNL